jgi:hypothetical protein
LFAIKYRIIDLNLWAAIDDITGCKFSRHIEWKSRPGTLRFTARPKRTVPAAPIIKGDKKRLINDRKEVIARYAPVSPFKGKFLLHPTLLPVAGSIYFNTLRSCPLIITTLFLALIAALRLK